MGDTAMNDNFIITNGTPNAFAAHYYSFRYEAEAATDESAAAV